ncbi:14208_t:CDS:2, partial [Funneliformis mosseae]
NLFDLIIIEEKEQNELENLYDIDNNRDVLSDEIELDPQFILYIYSSSIDFTNNDVKTNVATLIAADELCLNNLCDSIENYLLDNKESLKKNFILIQNVVSQITQLNKLNRFCKIVTRNDAFIIFKADDFTTMKQEILIDLLEKNKKKYSENSILIWDKLMEWIIAQSDDELPLDTTKWTLDEISTFRTMIRPFLPLINFETISPKDFFQKIKPFKNCFDHDFYIQILEYYSFSNNDVTVIHSKSSLDSKVINSKKGSLSRNSIKSKKQDRLDQIN